MILGGQCVTVGPSRRFCKLWPWSSRRVNCLTKNITHHAVAIPSFIIKALSVLVWITKYPLSLPSLRNRIKYPTRRIALLTIPADWITKRFPHSNRIKVKLTISHRLVDLPTICCFLSTDFAIKRKITRCNLINTCNLVLTWLMKDDINLRNERYLLLFSEKFQLILRVQPNFFT